MGTLGRAVRCLPATVGLILLAASASQAAEIPESGTLDLAAKADVRIGGLEESSFTGFSVARLGDVNGDGLADVAGGAPQANTRDRANAGSVFVIFGRAEAAPVDLANLGEGGYRIDGALPGDEAGFSLAPAGDLNGDGRRDLVLGGPAIGGERPGAAWVVFGKPDSGGVDLAAPGSGAYRIGGAQPNAPTGFSVGSLGDVNGDGRGELLVGAPRYDVNDSDRLDSGAVFVVRGSASATNVDLGALGGNGYRIDGEGHGNAGWAVDGSADMNGDSVPDVVLGAPFTDAADAPAAGSAYVAWGRTDTTNVDLASLGNGGFKLNGSLGRGPATGSEELSAPDMGTTPEVDADTLGEAAGASVAALGDINGDGVPDLAVGANQADRGSRLNAGSVYFVHGKANSDAVEFAAIAPAAGTGF